MRASVRKVLTLSAAAGLLLLPGSAATAATAGTVQVTIPTGSYEILTTATGHQISAAEFGRWLVPGQPNLPAKIFSVALPPGATVIGVSAGEGEPRWLPGRYNVEPVALPRVVGEERAEAYAADAGRRDATQATIYDTNELFPPTPVELVQTGSYRKYNLADVRVYPFSYNPVSGTLLHRPQVDVRVHYEVPDEQAAETPMVDWLPRTEARAAELIVNYADAGQWYTEEVPVDSAGKGLYDYVIITLESLTNSVQPLVDWELAKGRTVRVVTTEWIASNIAGWDLAEKMRNLLRDRYPSEAWGIEDVCLIGHYDDVPMRRCTQDVGYGSPETDYYYAELSLPDSESWDADGDHRWGEDSDPIDFTAEVNVGRIPWSDPATVAHICDKSVAYENNGDPSFKKNILLLGTYFWEDTDNAVLMEYKTDPSLHPWMSDWTSTKMYEEGYSTYPCDLDVTNANVRSTWSAGKYGFVNWAGHGSPTACYRMYEGGGYFISSGDCGILNDDYPAIIFADACSNSDTDYLNIGQAMMKQGGIGFLGSTKVAYGRGGWNHPLDGSTQSLDYYFTTCCTSGEYTQGQGHQWSLREMYTNGLWYYTKYEMFEWGALWGNPGLSMGTTPTLTMTFPEGLPEGRIPPGPETTIGLRIANGQENYVPDSGRLHYRFDPANPYSTATFTHVGGQLYSAVLPAPVPGDAPEFYFSAEGDGGTTVYSPFNAPETVYSAEVCLLDIMAHDDFEEDLGWTVESVNISAGEWERDIPNLTSGGQVAPIEDNPAGEGSFCFLTDNGPAGGSYSDYDIDGGPTHLMSPTIDLSSGSAIISSYNWYYSRDHNDAYTIDLSNDNGYSWTNVLETFNSLAGWEEISFNVADYITPNDQVKVRFSAQDQPNDDIVEAGVDDFRVLRIDYAPSIWAQAYSFSASAGCDIDIYLDAGPGYAGREYKIGGSFSGAHPGTELPGGETIPLNRDALTLYILAHLNGANFLGFAGTLDGDGRAVATLFLADPLNPGHAGKTVTIAFALTGTFDFVSNPVQIEIEP